MTVDDRARRTTQADATCRAAFEQALGDRPAQGMALVAVGGYGRRELAPYSDLDVVLVHDRDIEVGQIAASTWYPLWDGGVRLDHSVRALPEVTSIAARDVRVASGLLDARHLAGDPGLTLRLRSEVLAQWRRDARTTLPTLQRMVAERAEGVGELAHAAVPDLKESAGGLRDASLLKALVATWLVDVPHADLERCRRGLLDVRDVLHAAHGRPSDRITPEAWAAVAQGCGLRDERAAQDHVRALGRRTSHLSRLTWRRVDYVLAHRAGSRAPRGPRLRRLAPGVALSEGEVVLDRSADPAGDPVLMLRAAALAAEHQAPLSPASAARLVAESATLPDPWSDEARHWLVRLLAAGPGLLPVWETLDETGALDLLLPEWGSIRLLPHASVIHRYTVDRHVVETCIAAARLIRRVARPDLLMVAALLHDIGKGGLTDHCVAGEGIASRVARRMGFTDEDATVVGLLVRWHLLLVQGAVERDPEDPATVALVAERIPDADTLDLLEALTEADARATAPQAWTRWRAALVAELAARTRHAMRGRPAPRRTEPRIVKRAPSEDPGEVELRLEPRPEGARVTVVAPDRVGLMADVAGAFALLRIGVRSARSWTGDELASSEWEIDDPHVDLAIVRQRLQGMAAGVIEPPRSVPPAPAGRPGLPPVVTLEHEASREATVLEVRTDDRPGVLHLVLRALAELDLTVRSAHVVTLGPQVLDVFYVQEDGAGALSDVRAAEAAHAVRARLQDAATLDA